MFNPLNLKYIIFIRLTKIYNVYYNITIYCLINIIGYIFIFMLIGLKLNFYI